MHFISFCYGPLMGGDITQQKTFLGGILKPKPPTLLMLQVLTELGSLDLLSQSCDSQFQELMKIWASQARTETPVSPSSAGQSPNSCCGVKGPLNQAFAHWPLTQPSLFRSLSSSLPAAFIKPSLCTTHYTEPCAWIMSSHPPSNPLRPKMFLSSFYRFKKCIYIYTQGRGITFPSLTANTW